MEPEQYKKIAEGFDAGDELSRYGKYFSKSESIYLDGNSLGKLPLKSVDLIHDIVHHQWGDRLILSWNENWMGLPQRIAAKIARLVGAQPDEIFIGDSTSINLFKLACAALYYNKNKTEIITDDLNFPTDLYILQGLVANPFPNHKIKIIKSKDQISINEIEIHNAINTHTALLCLSHVLFKSAFMYNMKAINEKARKHNALTLWDLSHATGAVPIKLNEWGTDLAIGCTYKYLNGGPGSPAFLYVRKALQSRLSNIIWAWFGHQRPFDFDSKYQASDGIQKFATGTPSILSLAPVEVGVDILLEAGIDAIRQKSVNQTNFFIDMIKEVLIPYGFTISSPLNSDQRGSHISIQHHEAHRIYQAMIEPRGISKPIIPDFRPPNNIRLGIAALYTSYMDLWTCVIRMKEIMENKEYESKTNFSNETK